MKRLMIIIFLCVVSIPTFSQFATVWKKTSGDANLPAWFTASNNNVRNLAYGNNHIYLVQRNSGATVKIVSPSDGSDVGELNNGSGVISGGTFILNDVEVSSNGEIFACNLTSNASTSAFKIYRWTSEGGTPTNVISYTGLATRMGDFITVVGSTADNSAIIYAPSAVSTSVIKFTTTDNGASWTASTITLSDVAMGSGPSVYPVSNSSSANFFVKSSGQNIKEYSSAGTLQATLSGGIIATGNIDVAYFESGANKLVATVKFGSTATDNLLNLADVTSGTATATLYGSSVSLGTYNNEANGGNCAVKNNGNGSFDIFFVSPGNGFACVRTNAAPLPVELTSFTAIVNGRNVKLVWNTASELNNFGFEIERATINTWNKIGFVEGAGNSNTPRSYAFVDGFAQGVAQYRLKQIDRDGSFEYSSIVEANIALSANDLTLAQNYPNPFNPTTNISFVMPTQTKATVKVYNSIGQTVAIMFDGIAQEGLNIVTFDASSIPSGIYFYTLQSGNSIETKKMMLIK